MTGGRKIVLDLWDGIVDTRNMDREEVAKASRRAARDLFKGMKRGGRQGTKRGKRGYSRKTKHPKKGTDQ